MNVIGFASGFGKSRYIRDLRIKAFCPATDVLPNQVKSYEGHDIVTVYVSDIQKHSQRYFAQNCFGKVLDFLLEANLLKLRQ